VAVKTKEQLICDLGIALLHARVAQRTAFRAWEIAKHLIPDDLPPRERAERRQIIVSNKRLCLRAVRQATAIEGCIVRLKMD
jgi:hypothetical protein